MKNGGYLVIDMMVRGKTYSDVVTNNVVGSGTADNFGTNGEGINGCYCPELRLVKLYDVTDRIQKEARKWYDRLKRGDGGGVGLVSDEKMFRRWEIVLAWLMSGREVNFYRCVYQKV